MDYIFILLAILIVIIVGVVCLFLSGIFSITKLMLVSTGFFVLLIIACLLFACVEKTKNKNKNKNENEKK